MRFSPSHLWLLIKQSFSRWSEDRAPSMGAALAYYTAFSIAPLLLIVITVAGLVFGREAAQGEIFAQIQGMVGDQAAAAVQSMIQNASNKDEGIIGAVVGGLALIVGATTVFAELQDDLNRIWRAPPAEGSGIWNFIRTRILSFGLILAIGFLLIVSLVVTAGLSALGKYWGGLTEGESALLHIGHFVISFVVITLLFALIYKFLPRVDIAWGDVWVGAAATSLLFALGKFAIGLYIGRSAVASSFGAAGAFVALLLWIYYSTQIFLLGAEFTRTYAESHGSLAGGSAGGRVPTDKPKPKPAPWQAHA